MLPAEFCFKEKEVLIHKDSRTGEVTLSERKKSEWTWKDYFESAARLRAEAPQEFEDFMKDRKPVRPKERDIW
jgi:virulence-associated protein VagC